MLVGLFPELTAPGGIQRASRHMAAVLASEARRRGMPCRLYSLNDAEAQAQGRVGDIAFTFTGFQRSKARLVRAALSCRGGRPSVVLAAHPNLAPLAWAVRVVTGARMLVVAWGIDVWDPLPVARRVALRASDAVLAISAHTAAAVTQTQRVHPSRIRLLPLALEPAFWESAQIKAARPLPGRIGERRFVLTVTRLFASARYKGVDTAIVAFAGIAQEFPDVDYVVVGDGDDRSRLEALGRAAGLPDRIHFLGSVDEADLPALYAACDAVVLPSRGEGFGLVFVEAMAFGKPVVAGAHGAAPELVDDGLTGFLTPHGDVVALSGILRRLLSDRSLRSEMGRRGLERAEARYLFEGFQACLAAILAELIEDQRLLSLAPLADARNQASQMTVVGTD